MKISLSVARRLALNCQLLDGRTKLPKGKEGVAQTIEHLGYVQIDTISVIERAHHHTLWNRRPDYKHEHLHQLQAVDRRVFEYWGHAASYLPMSDYRYYLPLMKKYRTPFDKWMKIRLDKCGHLMKPVLKRIKEEGPLTSKDFESVKPKSANWWDWKPAKIALELLFWQGKLMITERRNFSRVYDLTERVLPGSVDTKYPTDEELARFLVKRALNAYGVATEAEIREHIYFAKSLAKNSIKSLLESNEFVPVQIDSSDKQYYTLQEHLEKISKLRKKAPQVSILSPFDNLIIQRKRVETLFGFDYTIECYVPAAKRKYGYFVLPILYGEQFAGRIDCKADRKAGSLIIRSLILEPGFQLNDEFMIRLADKIISFMKFNRMNSVKIEKCRPVKFKKELVSQIRRSL